MAQSYISLEGELIIPGAYTSIVVQSGNGGLAATGIVALIGEADAGPDYSLEDDLNANVYGPGQLAAVKAKYKSGNLVDAFNAVAQPANDEDITGSPTRIVVVKTNVSAKASTTLKKYDLSTYGTLADKSYGKLGNLIYETVTNAADEVIPTTGTFAFVPPTGTVDVAFRVSGAAKVQPAQFSSTARPNTFVTAVAALAGVIATGGAARAIGLVASTTTIAVAATGNTAVFTSDLVAWSTAPVVGDSIVIGPTSTIKGAGDANCGGWVVTAVGDNTVTATKVTDGTGGSLVSVTAPVNVVATAVSGTVANDFVVYEPVTISLEAGDPVEGIGKTLEVIQLTTGTDLFNRCARSMSDTSQVTWVSKTGTPKLLKSATERRVTLNVNRQKDAVTETLTAGGEIALRIGYKGTTATCTITETGLTTTVAGGTGAALSITLADFPTISDLATYINSQTGYSASAGTTAIGQQASTSLDRGTFNICSEFAVEGDGSAESAPGRIKRDAQALFLKVKNGSKLVQIGGLVAGTDPERVDCGLPGPTTTTDPTKAVVFLAGGTKGATTDAIVTAALAALEKVRCNFVVPLFSQDASTDIVDALTESSSTYTVAAVNAATKSHVLKMSTLKRRRNRQALLSYRGTWEASKTAAATMASGRCSMLIQDVKNLKTDTGSLYWFQPWMGATLAAGMQAAGFYRPIFGRGINCSGIIHADGTYNPEDDDSTEDGLKTGIMPMKERESGGFEFVSDQTTYSADSSFYFNSLQAVYVGDIMAMSLNSRCERKFKGKSSADIGAAQAQSFIEGILEEFRRNKFIAPSVDAPNGWKNLKVELNGTALPVEVEVKLAGGIYFIPINLNVAQVQQSA